MRDRSRLMNSIFHVLFINYELSNINYHLSIVTNELLIQNAFIISHELLVTCLRLVSLNYQLSVGRSWSGKKSYKSGPTRASDKNSIIRLVKKQHVAPTTRVPQVRSCPQEDGRVRGWESVC